MLNAFQALLQGVACQEQDGQSGMGFCVRRVPLGDANTHDGAYGRCARNATSRLSTQNPAISATIHVLSPVAVPRLRPCYPPAPNSLGRRRKKIISFTSDVYRGVTPTILSTSTFFFFFRQRRGGLEHGEHPALPLEVADEARERQEPLGCHMGGGGIGRDFGRSWGREGTKEIFIGVRGVGVTVAADWGLLNRCLHSSHFAAATLYGGGREKDYHRTCLVTKILGSFRPRTRRETDDSFTKKCFDLQAHQIATGNPGKQTRHHHRHLTKRTLSPDLEKEGRHMYTVAGHLKAGVEVTRVAHVPEAFPARHGLAVHPVPVQLLRPKPVPPTESKQQTPKQQQRRRRNMI